MQIQFLFPIDGDVLTPADGKFDGKHLNVRLKISAPEGSRVTVNEYEAKLAGSCGDGNSVYELALILTDTATRSMRAPKRTEKRFRA